MKCDNCPSAAVYELRQKPTSQFYCASHLPWFIKLRTDLNVKVFEVSSSAQATPASVVEEPKVIEEPKVTEEIKAPAKKKAEVKETTEEK
jgi:hypothetical protein